MKNVGLTLHLHNLTLLLDTFLEESFSCVVLPPSLTDEQVKEIIEWHKRGNTEPHPEGLSYQFVPHRGAKEDCGLFLDEHGKTLYVQLAEMAKQGEICIEYGSSNGHIPNQKSFFRDINANGPHACRLTFTRPLTGYHLAGSEGIKNVTDVRPFNRGIDDVHSLVSRITPFFAVTTFDLIGERGIADFAKRAIETTVSRLQGYRAITLDEFNQY